MNIEKKRNGSDKLETEIYRVDKKRDRVERQILDSQERAFWDVHRPVPGCVNSTEVDFRKLSRKLRIVTKNVSVSASPKGSLSPVPFPVEDIKIDIQILQNRLSLNVLKTSKIGEM